MSEASASPGTPPKPDHADLIAAARRQHEQAEAESPPGASPTTNSVNVASPGPVFTAPPPDSFVGYQILRELHRGGQGVVYQAIQKSTSRKVAIKVMRDGPFASASERARFEREVQVLGQLKHPNIVTIHDTGVAAGCQFFVMDYISGQPLDVYMASGPRSIHETLRLFAKVCEAVSAAHLRGVIHRDLKPGNIRVDAAGEPHILDFGLAKVAAAGGGSGENATAPCVTMTGQFVGSLPWASPEQADGAPSRIDIRTDVYSLGVILYQMLTGKFPYEVVGTMRDVLDRILRAEPVRPRAIRREIGDEVETIVLKCLRKDRERRYQSAGSLARDVQRFLRNEPIDAKRDSAWYLLRKSLHRHRTAALAAISFVVLLVASTVLAWSLYASALRSETLAGRRADDARRAALRADAAEREATERLWESYRAQAWARRMTQLPGRRFESLEALRQAAAIRPTLELRNDAIACLTLPDVRTLSELPITRDAISVTLSHTGKRMALGFEDGAVVIASMPEGRELQRLEGPRLRAVAAVFSPDERSLAVKYHTIDQIRTVVWNLAAEAVAFELAAGNIHSALGFAPDGSFAAVEPDGMLHAYRVLDGELCLTLGPMPSTYHLAFHPSGERLAVCGTDSSPVAIWSLEKREIVTRITAPGPVWRVNWSADGRLLAGGCHDHRVYVWDGATGKVVVALPGHNGDAVETYFAPGNRLLSNGWDLAARVWDLTTATQVIGPIEPYALIPNSHSSMGIVGRRGLRRLSEFNWADECRILALDGRMGGLASAAVHPGGRLLATGGDSGITLSDLASCRPLMQLSRTAAYSVSFRPDGSLVAATENTIAAWSVEAADGEIRVGPRQVLAESPNARCLSLTEDGCKAATVTSRGLEVIDLDGSGRAATLGTYRGLSFISISPAGDLAFSGSTLVAEDGGGRVWDLATGAVLRSFAATSIAGHFSPDGRWLVVSAGQSGCYEFHSTQSWELHHKVQRSAADSRPGVVAFCPGARLVALTQDRSAILLVDSETGEQWARLESPGPREITHLHFTPEGARLLAVSNDRTVEVWDLFRIRQQLRALGLDFSAPALPAPPEFQTAAPLKVLAATE